MPLRMNTFTFQITIMYHLAWGSLSIANDSNRSVASPATRFRPLPTRMPLIPYIICRVIWVCIYCSLILTTSIHTSNNVTIWFAAPTGCLMMLWDGSAVAEFLHIYLFVWSTPTGRTCSVWRTRWSSWTNRSGSHCSNGSRFNNTQIRAYSVNAQCGRWKVRSSTVWSHPHATVPGDSSS